MIIVIHNCNWNSEFSDHQTRDVGARYYHFFSQIENSKLMVCSIYFCNFVFLKSLCNWKASHHGRQGRGEWLCHAEEELHPRNNTKVLTIPDYIRTAVTIVSFLNVNAHTTGTNSNVSHSWAFHVINNPEINYKPLQHSLFWTPQYLHTPLSDSSADSSRWCRLGRRTED